MKQKNFLSTATEYIKYSSFVCFIRAFIIFLSISCTADSVTAQGYIDCATILGGDVYSELYDPQAKSYIRDGYTYTVFSNIHYDDPANELPVLGGGAPYTGRRYYQHLYAAVFDPNCNQIFGGYISAYGNVNFGDMFLDDTGNMVVTGNTYAEDFPTTDGSVSDPNNFNTWVQVISPTSGVLWSTLIYPEIGDSFFRSVISDGSNVYAAGLAENSGIPVTIGTPLNGTFDGLITKFDASGNLVWSTALVGNDREEINDISFSGNNIVVTGRTSSTDFPTTDGTTVNATGNNYDFLASYDPDGNLIFSTVYEVGTFDQPHVYADANCIYVVGETNSPNFITTDGTVYSNNFRDTHVRKYDTAGNLIFSSLINNTFVYNGNYAKLVNGTLYVMADSRGSGTSTTGDGPYGFDDVLVSQYDDTGLVMSTYYGGSGDDYPIGIDVSPTGEIYLSVGTTNNSNSTDNTSGDGTAYVKLNADGTLCAATIHNNERSGEAYLCMEVQGDTIWIIDNVTYGDGGRSTDGTIAGSTGLPNVQVSKFIFCPEPTPISSDLLSPSSQTVCQNSVVEQIIGEELFIDGTSFPPIYIDGVLSKQPDIELNYQWQVSFSASGPWTDIPGPLAMQANYSPPPTTQDVYYRRVTSGNECCGVGDLSTSGVSAVIVDNNVAPTVDAGGTFYTCPGSTISIGGSPAATGGTPGYTYSWNDGAYTDANPDVTVTESTIFTLFVTDANGCVQADQATVVVYSVDAGEDGSVCEGEGATIGGTPLAGVPVLVAGDSPPAGEYSISYSWLPNDGSLSCTDCPNPTATPTVATDYTMTATLYYPDGNSCQTSDMVNVNIISVPGDGNLAVENTVICLGEMLDLGQNHPPLNEPSISAVMQSSTDGFSNTSATIANLTDGDFSTGGHTSDGDTQNITIDLGSPQLINTIQAAALNGRTNDDVLVIQFSTDNINFTTIQTYSSGLSATALTSINFEPQMVQYIRLSSNSSSRDVSLSEFHSFYDYIYIWTPGDYIIVDGGSAVFDAGNVSMPDPNPITYTVTANLGDCNFYDQVTVSVIEARAGNDYCGPRYVGVTERTPDIGESYSWSIINDPSLTTGTGSFLGVSNEDVVPVSESVGGNVAYELTVTYAVGDSMAICRDTVIVPPACGAGCDIVVKDGNCPSFDNSNVTLLALPPNPEEWTYSWTSNEGQVGLDNYNSQEVNLTDGVTRTYTVTMTSVLDPNYTCTDFIEVNSPSFSTPVFNPASPVSLCAGDPTPIGDPANNPGLSYAWSNPILLDNDTISQPLATVSANTEFTVTVTDRATGCFVVDTVLVDVGEVAVAGEDFTVCDNGVITLGLNQELPGYTYAWTPAAADWRNGTDQNSAMPDVFVAASQEFKLTMTHVATSCVTMDSVMITVDPLPPVFTLPDLNYCPSQVEPLVLGTNDGTNTGTNLVPNGFTYVWSPTTVSDPNLQNPTVNTPLPNYPVSYEVLVRTAGGCNQRATQNIIPTVSAPLVGLNETICVGESIAIGDVNNPTTNTTYSWSPATDLNDQFAINPVFTPSAAGTTTFTVTKTSNGCSTTNEITITVLELTPPVLSPLVICEGNTVQIGTTPETGLSYEWTPTTGLDNPYIANPNFIGTSTTNYVLTIIDVNGCTAEASTSVTVNPAPALTISLPDTTVCNPLASSIIINAGVEPTGDYAYNWSPSTFLSNRNALNPEFFIPGEGTYEYVLEVIDQSTGCSLFDTTVMNVSYTTLPEVTAFAIQPSCIDGAAQSDGYLQISAAAFADRFHWSAGGTFDDNSGTKTFDNALSLSGLTYPYQFNTGLSNADIGAYTLRVYSDAADCYSDVVVVLNEQDCTIGCNCEEMLYLAEPEINAVLKFKINSGNILLTELPNRNGTFPWYPGDGTSELPYPHGTTIDLNGNIYVGSDFAVGSPIRKFTCDGTIQPEDATTIQYDYVMTNMFTIENILYGSRGGGPAAYNLCTGDEIGTMCLNDENGNQINVNNTTGGGNVFWGLQYNDISEMVYVTAANGSTATKRVWSFTKNELEAGIAGGDCADPLISDINATSNYTDIPVGSNFLPNNINTLAGITSDNIGNVYVTGWLVGAARQGFVLKYDAGGTLLAKATLNPSFVMSRGIVWSETTNQLYLANQTDDISVDCISSFDANDLAYLGTAAPNPNLPVDNQAKALDIIKECCPTNNNITIDTMLCAVALNDTIFLQKLINCEGPVCEGIWEEGMSNTGLTYNSCNNSITVNALTACGSYTLESDGTGANAQCGAFKIEVNIAVANITAPEIVGNQTICEGEAPEELAVTVPATGSNTITYQWQSSLDSLFGYSDITGATGLTYNPPANIRETTYYRLISSSNGTCNSGICRDTSSVLSIRVQGCDYPVSFNPCETPACHIISNDIYLGTEVTSDNSATGESSPDDGFTAPNDLHPGNAIRFPVTIYNNTGNTAYLSGWVDWNGDGDFDDTNELIAQETYNYSTPNTGTFTVLIPVTVPMNAIQNQDLNLRWRISTDASIVSSPCGAANCAPDGEVEDYLLRVACPSAVCMPPSLSIRSGVD